MEPKIHVCRNKDTLGVFTEAQLKMALGRGSVTENDYCWTEGMKDWKPISQTYPHLIPSRPSSQQTAPAYPSGPYQPPSASQTYAPSAPANAAGYGQQVLVYPTGGERFGAYLLDGLFMMLMFCGAAVPFFIFLAVIMEGDGRSSARAIESLAQPIGIFAGFFGSLLYYGLQGTTAHNATWGQRIMGFKMVDARTGAAPQSGQIWQWAFFRSIILTCCSCLGLLFFIPILNDNRKQSAFDSWAGILMVKK